MFGKKKATGMYCFLALSGKNPLRGIKDKRRVLKAVHEAVRPAAFPFLNYHLEIAFSEQTTKIYPWEWASPTVLDKDTNEDHLSKTWDAIVSYMQKHYDSFDIDMLEETATSGISRSRDSAVFFFSQNK